jgi:hypothetical protein
MHRNVHKAGAVAPTAFPRIEIRENSLGDGDSSGKQKPKGKISPLVLGLLGMLMGSTLLFFMLFSLIFVGIPSWASQTPTIFGNSDPPEPKCFFAGSRKETMENVPKFTTTVVSGFFVVPNKHTDEEYNEWMENFMQLDTPFVVFTNTEETARKLESVRPQRLQDKLYICILSLYDLDVYRDYGHRVWKKQASLDPEIHLHHDYPIYLIWLGKVEFVLKTIEKNPFGSEFFMWNDLGGFRQKEDLHKYVQNWPNPDMVRKVCSDSIAMILMDDHVLHQFCGHGEITTKREFLKDKRYNLERQVLKAGAAFTLAGSPQCGTAAGFKRYYGYFSHVLRMFIETDMFAGKDQTVMAMIAISRPELINLVYPPWNDWFYFNTLFETPFNGTMPVFPSCNNLKDHPSDWLVQYRRNAAPS